MSADSSAHAQNLHNLESDLRTSSSSYPVIKMTCYGFGFFSHFIDSINTVFRISTVNYPAILMSLHP